MGSITFSYNDQWEYMKALLLTIHYAPLAYALSMNIHFSLVYHVTSAAENNPRIPEQI